MLANECRPITQFDLLPAAPQAAESDQERTERLRRVQRLAGWMDTSFSIPGTPVKFGWDSLLGLIPGVGDVVTAATGGWVIREAYRAGAPKRVMARMLGNVTVDMTVGAIPLVGDLFDVFWKSNVRNARLLEQHLTKDASQQ